MKIVELDLTREEVQLVLNALCNLPYGQVEAIIGNIRNQVMPQIMMQDQEPAGNEAA